MKVMSYQVTDIAGPQERAGVVLDEDLVDINLAYRSHLLARRVARAAEIADVVVPTALHLLLGNGAVGQEAVRAALAHAADDPNVRRPLDEIVPAPLLQPQTLREFSLYEAHLSRGGRRPLPEAWYSTPLYWKGNPHALIAPEADIAAPAGVRQLDFELEIAAVIGEPGIDIEPVDAMRHVAGFTIFNDVSARDIQRNEMTFLLGPSKSKDFCNVMGPVLATPDELGDDLHASVRVNGESWAETSTAGMQFGWPDVIAHASRGEWLRPGDVLTSGTLVGCSALEHYEWDEDRPYLAPGDVVELEVEGIGTLRNYVASPP